ncbi:hypothetical protein KEM48_002011 [Puccinia striiformis f. sp. tritici PST-130]|nr:hypothetical protein KEM48_002011 [Puccinia striiformis f. sp. tritici PST-130]
MVSSFDNEAKPSDALGVCEKVLSTGTGSGSSRIKKVTNPISLMKGAYANSITDLEQLAGSGGFMISSETELILIITPTCLSKVSSAKSLTNQIRTVHLQARPSIYPESTESYCHVSMTP